LVGALPGMACRRTKTQGKTKNDMETSYHDGNNREESTRRRLDGQRKVENFGNRKALKDDINRMMMMMMMMMMMKNSNLKRLNEEKVKEQYQVTNKNKFAALENLDDNGDIDGACDTIRENIKISAKESIGLCESKSHKP
jgi:hypothetical protein